jgi:hypothetical protein
VEWTSPINHKSSAGCSGLQRRLVEEVQPRSSCPFIPKAFSGGQGCVFIEVTQVEMQIGRRRLLHRTQKRAGHGSASSDYKHPAPIPFPVFASHYH